MTGPVVAAKLRIPNAPSMPLERLDGRLDAVWQHRLAIVVAPAGSGKTTLLTRLAARAPGPVGWYRAEGWDADEAALLRHVEAALVPALEGITRDWTTVEEAANALAKWRGSPALLIVDDAHTLQGTPAEAALERLIDYAPDWLRFVVASRVLPEFNLSRLRVSDDLLEFGGGDLRFRSWEVERLFRDYYREPLAPEELARLARRTEGWAAGLQLFHLATRGRTADERRRMLAELDGSARLTREYLARNVLYQLPDDLRRFLVDTSVLGRMTGPLCDLLLDRTGSGEILADLEHRRLFTQYLAEDNAYRYHEVLRAHLHATLLEELGEDGMHARFSAAGALLAGAGAVSEALEAYCRGEDWDGARGLLEGRGELVAERPSEWVDTLPAPMVRHDPWLLLASARQLRVEGRLREASERYQAAETAFGRAQAASTCRDERLVLASWLETATPAVVRTDGFAVLRAALRRDPAGASEAARALPPATGSLIAGLAALLAGNVASARRELLHAAERSDASKATAIVASLGAGIAGALMGQPHAELEIDGALAAAERAGLEWIERVGRAAFALTGSSESVREAEVVAAASDALGDEWGAALARLCATWGALLANERVSGTDALIVSFRALDAPVLEAWIRGLDALGTVRAGDADAHADAAAATSVARSVGVDGALLLAHLARAEGASDPDEADEQWSVVMALAQETGLRAPVESTRAHLRGDAVDALVEPPAAMEIRLLGGFELQLGGQPVDLTAIRPRARALLRLLSLNAGKRVHHETIEAALWPDADSVSSARNLHVAVAALRRALEPAAMRGSFQLLRREGDAYTMAVPEGHKIDIREFDSAVVDANVARKRGDSASAASLYQRALDLYRGELLPEDGPAEWVAERREACRLAAVEATAGLAEILLARGEASHAARACTLGLQIERYHDPLWRLLISARDQAGDQGAAQAARLGYDRMLAELGVAPAIANNSPQ